MQADQVLKTVRLSEKSNKLSSELGQYTFEVFKSANKHAIAQAVEETFKVTVRRVNVMTIRGKNKKSRQCRPSIGSDYKKAIVTLQAGDKSEVVQARTRIPADTPPWLSTHFVRSRLPAASPC